MIHYYVRGPGERGDLLAYCSGSTNDFVKPVMTLSILLWLSVNCDRQFLNTAKCNMASFDNCKQLLLAVKDCNIHQRILHQNYHVSHKALLCLTNPILSTHHFGTVYGGTAKNCQQRQHLRSYCKLSSLELMHHSNEI